MTDSNLCSANSNISKQSRLDWLDWLRAVAIILVLGSHYQIDWWNAGVFRPLAQFNMRVGWSGVDMFFVISGFLIGGLLINENRIYGTIDLKRFYLRRAAKIWPLLYAVPLIYVVFFYAFSETDRLSLSIQFLPTLFHVQNFFYLPLGHLWSLAVEEHFYVILPIIIFTISRYFNNKDFPRFLLATLLFISAGVISLRVISVYLHGVAPGTIRVQTQYRLDSLIFGVSLAWIYNFKPGLWGKIQRSNLTIIFSILCLWPFVFNPNYSLLVSSIGLSFLALFYGSLIFLTLRFKCVLEFNKHIGLILNILSWIGRKSYAIYLFHPFVWLIMVRFGVVKWSNNTSFIFQSLLWICGYIIFIVLSIIIGAIVSSVAEKPLLAFRNRIIPAKSFALKSNSIEVI